MNWKGRERKAEAYFKVLFHNLIAGIEESHEISQDTQSLGSDLIWVVLNTKHKW
jgi:hypothetical protein